MRHVVPSLSLLAVALFAGCESVWPQQVIHDGGDRDFEAVIEADGKLGGVDAQDTVGGYVTKPDGKPGVTQSNRVAVDAPRFVMVSSSRGAEVFVSDRPFQIDAARSAGEQLRGERRGGALRRASGYGGLRSETTAELDVHSSAPVLRADTLVVGENVTDLIIERNDSVRATHIHQTDLAAQRSTALTGAQLERKNLPAGLIDWAHCSSEAAAPLVTMLVDARTPYNRVSTVGRLDGLRARSGPSRGDQVVGPWQDVGDLPPQRDRRAQGASQDTGEVAAIGTRHAKGPARSVARHVPDLTQRALVPVLSDSVGRPEEYGLTITPWRAITQRHLASLSRTQQFRLLHQHQVVVRFGRPCYPHYILDAHAANEARAPGTVETLVAGRGAAATTDEPKRLDNLLLVKSVDRTEATYGTILTFTIAFRNVELTPIDRVVIVDSLHERLQYEAGSATCTHKAEIETAPNEVGSVVIRWKLEKALAPGEQGKVTFRAKTLAWPEAEQR